MFGKNDIDELKSYIHDNIKFGDNLEVMQMIDNSEIKPTKKLLDVIGNVLETKK